MNADYKILFDANVLANHAVCDLYLRLAEKPRLLLPKWTKEILNEVHKTQVEKLGWDPKLADTFRQALSNAFPEALITGYEELIPLMTNDEKDRHVLAAAVREKLDIIITFNLKDFKPDDLDKWGIRAIHPQDYMLTLYSMNPQVVVMKLNQIARKKKEELEDTIIRFGTALPAFSTRLLDDMGK
ncbi:PIN domain-containing protein [soil metagenome]